MLGEAFLGFESSTTLGLENLLLLRDTQPKNNRKFLDRIPLIASHLQTNYFNFLLGLKGIAANKRTAI